MDRSAMTSPNTNSVNPEESTDLLEALGKASALATALVPASGVLIRFVALTPTGPPGFEMAYMAPLGQLAMTGFLALIPTVVIFYLANRSKPEIIQLRARENIKTTLKAREMNSARLRRIITAGSATDVEALTNTKQEVLSDVRQQNQQLRQSYQQLESSRNPSRWVSLGMMLAFLVMATSIVTIPLAITSLIGGIGSAFLFFRAIER